MSNVMRPRFVVRRVLCARPPWRGRTRAQRWCPAEAKPLRARSAARCLRMAGRCSQAHVSRGWWCTRGRCVSHRCAAAFAVRVQARARVAWSACRGRGFVVGLRITAPSSGQPQAAFGCLRLPLMSNVMRPRFVVRRVLCARTLWRSHTRAQRWCPAEAKPLRARSTARCWRAAGRCSRARVSRGWWCTHGRCAAPRLPAVLERPRRPVSRSRRRRVDPLLPRE